MGDSRACLFRCRRNYSRDDLAAFAPETATNQSNATVRTLPDGAETLEFDNGREACNYAASFLIAFSEHVFPAPTPDEERRRRELGKALEEQSGGDDRDPDESEANVEITELAVVCVEKGVHGFA